MKLFILSCMLCFSYSIVAQTEIHSSSKKDKKVVTIKKSIDKDGNEVIEKKVLEGDGIKKEDQSNENGSRSITITIDSNGHQQKIIIDKDIRITEDLDKGESIYNNSGGNFTDRTVIIKKNADGSIEVKEKSGEDFGSQMNIKVDSTEAKKASLGISLNDELKITQLVKDGAAEKAGLEEEDQVTHLDGTFINDYDHLKSLLSKKNVGDKVTLTYLRDRKEMKSSVTLKGGATRVYFNR